MVGGVQAVFLLLLVFVAVFAGLALYSGLSAHVHSACNHCDHTRRVCPIAYEVSRIGHQDESRAGLDRGPSTATAGTVAGDNVRQTITVSLLLTSTFIGANTEVARLLLFDLTNLVLLTRRGYRWRRMIARLVNLSRHNERRLAKKISYFQRNSMLVFARADHHLNLTPRLSMQLSRQILLSHFDGT
jgi:hypothetical protein